MREGGKEGGRGREGGRLGREEGGWEIREKREGEERRVGERERRGETVRETPVNSAHSCHIKPCRHDNV